MLQTGKVAMDITAHWKILELNQMGFVTRKGNPFSKVSICEWLRHPFPFAGCLVWNRRDKNRKLNPPEEWVKVENAYQGIIT